MLHVHDLACVRGDLPLFAGVGFEVQAGEVLWVEGSNGSGKTSLLRILCGLSPPAAGEVRWRGEPARAARESFAREVLYLGHANALKDDLTIAENLRYSARLCGAAADDDAIDGAIAAVGLIDRADLAVRVLSQGQRRRVALARLWCSGPRPLWILDEPFSALDAASVQRLADHLGAHVEGGGLAVLTTHQEVSLPGRTRRLRLDA